MSKLQDVIAEQEKLDNEERLLLSKEVQELREKINRIVDLCAEKCHTQAGHPKSCKCLNCRDLRAVQSHILMLKA